MAASREASHDPDMHLASQLRWNKAYEEAEKNRRKLGASNANAQDAMRQKMEALGDAQQSAKRVEDVGDGRIRYYTAEKPSDKSGDTRGAAYVTEHNTKTGQVRAWMECYDHNGDVNRVHPKMVNGHQVRSPHYPPTKAEIEEFSKTEGVKK